MLSSKRRRRRRQSDFVCNNKRGIVIDSPTRNALLKTLQAHATMSEEKPFPDPADALLLGGIFSGIGGWEAAAGEEWAQVFAAENNPQARKVFEANTGRAPEVGDILTAPASAAPFAHVYTVSFPCQSSSQAGARKGRADPRGQAVLAKALEMIEHAQPIILLLENVKGFLSVDRGGYFEWLRERLYAIGYPRVHWRVLPTHHFGLPQQRERLYVIALRADIAATADFRFPVGDVAETPSLSHFLRMRLARRFALTVPRTETDTRPLEGPGPSHREI